MLKKATLFIAILIALFLVHPSQALTWDIGHHEFSSGYEGELALLNDASADITGGHIGILWGEDSSTVNTYDGCMIDLLRPNINCTANVYGGEMVDGIFALGTSTTRLYGGSIHTLKSVDSSIVYFYAIEESFDPTGGIFHEGLLSVTWLDSGDSISIDLGYGTYEHIVFVPDPCGFFALLLGSVYVSRRNKI